MSKVYERYCTVQEGLRESLEQMQLIRKGKMKRKSLNELLDQLEKEIEEEEKYEYKKRR